MKILHTLPRHAADLHCLQRCVEGMERPGVKFICVVLDGPEAINRQASWASSFEGEDTHKIFQALADQTRET